MANYNFSMFNVLVAEDNRVNQQVAVGMLERAGHQAKVAEKGKVVVQK